MLEDSLQIWKFHMKKEDCFHLGVKALIRNTNKRILLLKRNHKLEKTYWDLPGGRLQKGESLMTALMREVKEETGLSEIHQVLPFSMILTDIRIPVVRDDVGLIFSIFLCDISFPFSPQLSEEHISFDWFTPLETAQKLTRYPVEFTEQLINLD